ncbi:MAG TPA: cupin domain-containing protein [Thermoflexia bacterium]|jgi:quercetin dioxygenase-like cupin family protein|nr:cupin domain-containing protein [Thermoflexia bacterium]
MGVLHRFAGSDGRLDWEGVPEKKVAGPDVVGVSGKVLIGPQDGAPHFRVRYFRIEPGGHSGLDQHPHDHGVYILHGRGRVRMGDEEVEVSPGDVVYIPGNEPHQFRAIGDEPLGFLCVVPAA